MKKFKHRFLALSLTFSLFVPNLSVLAVTDKNLEKVTENMKEAMNNTVLTNDSEIFVTEASTEDKILGETPFSSEIIVSLKEGTLYEHKATLTLNDKDGCIFEDQTPKLYLIKDDIVINTYDLKVGENEIDLGMDLDPEQQYKLDVRASYNIGNGINKRDITLKSYKFKSLSVVPGEIDVVGLKVMNVEGEEKEYFSMREKVMAEISINDPKVKADQVSLGGELVPAKTEEGKIVFEITVPDDGDTSYEKAIDALLMGGKEIKLRGEDTNKKVSFKIEKNNPQVLSIGTKKVEDKLNTEIKIEDADTALSKVVVKFYKEENEEYVAVSEVVKDGSVETITTDFDLTEDIVNYKIEVLFSGNRGHKEYADELVSEKEIHITTESLDLKDIAEVKLYHNGTAVETLNISGGIPQGEDLKNYYLEIQPVYAAKLYANVKEFKQADGKVYAVADLDEFLTFKNNSAGLQSENTVSFEIVTGQDSGSQGIKSADEFIQQIKNNLGGTHELTEDLDASKISVTDATYITGNFTGTLKGNGHTIYGLNKPLFNNISGGKVENIKFKDANVNEAKGILAVAITNNGTVDRVTFEDSTLTTTTNGVGMICGGLQNSSILNTTVINCSISGDNTIGGIAGEVQAGAKVEGCFVYDTFVKGTRSHSLGSRVGGITGWLNPAGSIKNSYTNVRIESNGNGGAGGLIGGPNGGSGVIENVIAISTGNGQQIAGFDAALNQITNVYQLADADSKNTANGLQTVDEVTKDFLVNQIKLTEEHWKILDAKNTLLGENSNLKHISTYQKENDQRYINVMKIAPFLSTESVVQMGNFLTSENLKNKAVLAVYPFDESGNLVEYLKSGQDSSIKQIKIAYSDNTFDVFNVSYNRTADDIVAIYHIDGDSIPYHFDKYITRDESGIAAYIQEKANALDYDTQIKTTVGGNEDIRLYKEVYEKEIKSELSKAADILVGTRYNYTINNTHLGDKIKAEVDAELAKLLYNYTYFRKSYDFKIGGINLANLLTFYAEKLNPELTFDYLHNQLKAGNRKMNQTYDKYTSMIQAKTGTALYPQLEFFIRMSGTEDYNQWFVDNWKGHVAEQDPVGYDYTPLLNWRIWDNLTNLYGVHAHLLHILTIPEEIQPQMGIISTSSQLVFSEASIYYADPESNLEKFYQKVDNCAVRYGRYYGTPLGFVENGEENLNADLCMGYDTIGKYANPAYSEKQGYGTEAPMVKYMMEPREVMFNDNSKGAVANGRYIFYGYMHALGDDLGIFTHENAHNQDSDFFYAKAGRRPGAGGEHHAEGMLTQSAAVSTWEGVFNFNSMYNFNIEDNVIVNFSYERINTREEIHDFYRDLFEVWYVANAMYGEAFIEAPKTVQENVNKKINITGSGNSLGTQYGTGYWSEDMERLGWEMNSLDDLFNYKIAFRPIESAESGYYIELFWPVMWYTPNNPEGVADPGTFKIMAYDMLGYAGWDKGLVEWASARHQNDNEAIQAITGYDTVIDYRKARITEAAEKAKTSPYFHSEQLEKIIGASYATEDRKSVDNTLGIKKILTHAIKRVTDDFTNGTVYEESTNIYKVGTAEELIAAVENTCSTTGVMIKLTNDIDFSGVEAAGNAYINRMFGFIEGNGYKISGLKKPLFDKMMYTMVRNLELEGESNVLLANTSSFALVHHFDYDKTKTLINSGDTKQNVYTYFIGKEFIGEGTTLDTPENFKAEAGNGQVTLSWTAPAGKVTKYQVSKDNGSSWTDVINETSYTYTDLINGTAYQFKVRAVNEVGEGRIASIGAMPFDSSTMQTAETPVFSPNGGTFTEAQTVTISSATEGASIYYTTDGSQPDTSSTPYRQPVTVNETTTIKAIAVKADMNNSTVASATFTINKGASDQMQKVSNPVISPNGGIYTQAQKVSIISETADARIYYTVDGAVPTDKSTLYSEEITIDKTTTIKAIAIKEGMTDSDVVEAGFTIEKGDSPQEVKVVADPAISPNGGTYDKAQNITITSDTSGAKIYYTTDGSTPTEKSNLYSKPFVVSKDTVIKAIAVKDGMTNSKVTTINYVISGSAISGSEIKDKPWIFTDVAQDNGWKHLSVKYVYNNDIMGAITGTTLFQPDRQLERGMFATMLYRMAGSPQVTYKEKFSDVPAGKWYSDAIIWANENKIVDGYSDGSFGVTDFITREQIAKMLYEYATRVAKYDTKARKDLNSFTDAKEVSSWAITYMQWVTAVEMITGKPNGDGTFRMDPEGKATRAECAAMLERFAKKYE